MCFYEFFKVFGYFLEIKCDDAGIINYYLFIFIVVDSYLPGSAAQLLSTFKQLQLSLGTQATKANSYKQVLMSRTCLTFSKPSFRPIPHDLKSQEGARGVQKPRAPRSC